MRRLSRRYISSVVLLLCTAHPWLTNVALLQLQVAAKTPNLTQGAQTTDQAGSGVQISELSGARPCLMQHPLPQQPQRSPSAGTECDGAAAVEVQQGPLQKQLLVTMMLSSVSHLASRKAKMLIAAPGWSQPCVFVSEHALPACLTRVISGWPCWQYCNAYPCYACTIHPLVAVMTL